jgi:hypothetical protein
MFFPLFLWDFTFTLHCRALKVVYPLVAAVGLGCLFQVCAEVAWLLRLWAHHVQTPLIGLQAAMPIKDMATSTSTFGFIRQVFLPACYTRYKLNCGAFVELWAAPLGSPLARLFIQVCVRNYYEGNLSTHTSPLFCL